ncbi:MAG: methyltransferase domain-containing protein [Bdellovibrionales bacterium]
MNDSSFSGASRQSAGNVASQAWAALRGFAEDFWHDGDENPVDVLLGRAPSPAHMKVKLSVQDILTREHGDHASSLSGQKEWHALPGEISEIMWGAGNMMPGGIELYDKLITPLCLNKDMSVLDISAGLGGHMRRATEQFGAYFTGLEPDAEIAARGMLLSQRARQEKRAPIKTYDPLRFKSDRHYDCVLAREVFYRVADKPRFFNALASGTKASAQIAFTDYTLEPEHARKASVLLWKGVEPNAAPLSLADMSKAWSQLGFRMHISENLTEYYCAEVLVGVKRLATYLIKHPNPDSATREGIKRHVIKWSNRMAAMKDGLMFCRFYGSK